MTSPWGALAPVLFWLSCVALRGALGALRERRWRHTLEALQPGQVQKRAGTAGWARVFGLDPARAARLEGERDGRSVRVGLEPTRSEASLRQALNWGAAGVSSLVLFLLGLVLLAMQFEWLPALALPAVGWMWLVALGAGGGLFAVDREAAIELRVQTALPDSLRWRVDQDAWQVEGPDEELLPAWSAETRARALPLAARRPELRDGWLRARLPARASRDEIRILLEELGALAESAEGAGPARARRIEMAIRDPHAGLRGRAIASLIEEGDLPDTVLEAALEDEDRAIRLQVSRLARFDRVEPALLGVLADGSASAEQRRVALQLLVERTPGAGRPGLRERVLALLERPGEFELHADLVRALDQLRWEPSLPLLERVARQERADSRVAIAELLTRRPKGWRSDRAEGLLLSCLGHESSDRAVLTALERYGGPASLPILARLAREHASLRPKALAVLHTLRSRLGRVEGALALVRTAETGGLSTVDTAGELSLEPAD